MSKNQPEGEEEGTDTRSLRSCPAEQNFLSLDDEDMDYIDAEKKIDTLEAYEYYLSETFPASTMLNNAMLQVPEIGPVMEILISRIMAEIDENTSRKDVMVAAVRILQEEMESLAEKD